MTSGPRPRPGLRRVLRLDPDVSLGLPAGAEEPPVVHGDGWDLPVGHATPAMRAALASLAVGTDEEDAADAVHSGDGVTALTRWSLLLQQLLDAGAVRSTLVLDGRPLATVGARTHGARLVVEPLAPDAPVALSRFASLRLVDGTACVTTPLGRARVWLHDPRLGAVIAALAGAGNRSEPDAVPAAAPAVVPGPVSARWLAASAGLDTASVAAVLGLLRAANALADADDGLSQWEEPDAAFHAHSRLGRRDRHYGATYRFGSTVAPLPAVAPPLEELVPLAVPDPAHPAVGPSLSSVLERRRSRRSFSDRPVDVAVLAELLHRSVRNTSAVGSVVDPGSTMERVTRPYPSAGGCHPLEVYVVTNRCTGVPRGLHRYEPGSHALEHRPTRAGALESLLADAQRAARLQREPPVLVVVAARFARSTWKYEGIAYANLLKEAGALLQTLYLVGTAMELAVCALGGGDADVFAQAAGTSYWEETSVAELVVGHPEEGP